MPPAPENKAVPPKRRRPGRPAKPADNAEVRARLLDAATELAVERGLDGAGIREIAERADVSSGMISYYFGDRRGLHEAMSRRAFDELASEFEKALADQEPGADILDVLIRVHATALSARPWLPRLIAREVLGSEGEMRDRLAAALGAGPLEIMRTAIRDSIERGALRPDLDPTMCVLTIASTGAFPYLMGPILGEHLGVDLDEDFRDRLIAHNRDLIANGLRAPAQKEKLR